MKHCLLLLFFISFEGLTFVHMKTGSGKKVHWEQLISEMEIDINANAIQASTKIDLNEFEVRGIINNSIRSWNEVSPYTLNTKYTNSTVSKEGNISISFSDNKKIFGSGVVAVTTSGFDEDSGTMFSGHIYINDSKSPASKLTKYKSSTNQQESYLGDIITHELGHLFGLSHSQVIDSSMNYIVSKGAFEIADDDRHGIKTLYNLSSDIGKIQGKVIAGSERNSVFGVDVQLISLVDGVVRQSVLTNELGEFYFKNVNIKDRFVLFISPVKNKSTLSNYYSEINNNYCNGKSFVPSFFSTCGPRGRSNAQEIIFDDNSNLVNIGEVTIKCDYSLSREYFASKFTSLQKKVNLDFDLNKSKLNFYGYMSEKEITPDMGMVTRGDFFSIDARKFDNSNSDLILNVQLVSGALGLPTKYDIYIKKSSDTNWSQTSGGLNNITGKLKIDFNTSITLSSNSSLNVFDIKIVPQKLTGDEKIGFFGASAEVSRSRGLYIVSFEVLKDSTALDGMITSHIEDNSMCAEGDNLVTAQGYTPVSSVDGSLSQKNDDLGVVSCGTLNLDDDNHSGPGSFLLGVALILFFTRFNKIKDNFLS